MEHEKSVGSYPKSKKDILKHDKYINNKNRYEKLIDFSERMMNLREQHPIKEH